MNEDIGKLIEPAPVQFTWGAPGWYVLTGLLLLCLLAVVVLFVSYYRRNRYRREALSWLALREEQLMTAPSAVVYDATLLLKRIVMTRYGREHASVRGSDWIELLNRTSGSSVFSREDAAFITDALYVSGAKISDLEAHAYLNKTRTWIKQHRYAL